MQKIKDKLFQVIKWTLIIVMVLLAIIWLRLKYIILSDCYECYVFGWNELKIEERADFIFEFATFVLAFVAIYLAFRHLSIEKLVEKANQLVTQLQESVKHQLGLDRYIEKVSGLYTADSDSKIQRVVTHITQWRIKDDLKKSLGNSTVENIVLFGGVDNDFDFIPGVIWRIKIAVEANRKRANSTNFTTPIVLLHLENSRCFPAFSVAKAKDEERIDIPHLYVANPHVSHEIQDKNQIIFGHEYEINHTQYIDMHNKMFEKLRVTKDFMDPNKQLKNTFFKDVIKGYSTLKAIKNLAYDRINYKRAYSNDEKEEREKLVEEYIDELISFKIITISKLDNLYKICSDNEFDNLISKDGSNNKGIKISESAFLAMSWYAKKWEEKNNKSE